MRARDRVPALDRQHIAFWRVQPLVEHPRHPRALFGIVQFGIGGVDIGRQRRLALDPVRGVFVDRQHIFRAKPEPLRRALRQPLCIGNRAPYADSRCWRSGPHSSRSECRPCARTARTPSAAGFRPDTICPARNAAARPAQNDRAACGSTRRRAHAWSGRRRRCSIPAIPCRRWRRRSARRPWSAARHADARSASTCSPSASSRAQDSSENGFVMRGASRMRFTLISKANSTSAKPALPEIGAAER